MLHGLHHNVVQWLRDIGRLGGVRPALTQPGHQHFGGAGGDGQQRVIAPLASVTVVAGSLFGQA